MSLNPIISICIPTFNRGEKVHKLVLGLLTYCGEELEVIVLDNGSSDDTNSLLVQIADNRFFFIRNEQNIGGAVNPIKALSQAKGNYCFLCLDKDNIRVENIPELISRLKTDPDVVFGHCSLNLEQEASDIIYDKGFDSVYNMVYLSEHPSGTFYNTDYYKKLDILSDIFNEKKKFGFYVDLINAEMSVHGKSRLINLPLFYTETKQESSKTASYTYSKTDFFFSPRKRMIEFNLYIKSLRSLKLTKDQFKIMTSKLYSKGMNDSTFLYKYFMNDESVCSHYGIAKKHIGFIRLCKINFLFSINFLKQKLPVKFLTKCRIFLAGQKSFYRKMIN